MLKPMMLSAALGLFAMACSTPDIAVRNGLPDRTVQEVRWVSDHENETLALAPEALAPGEQTRFVRTADPDGHIEFTVVVNGKYIRLRTRKTIDLSEESDDDLFVFTIRPDLSVEAAD